MTTQHTELNKLTKRKLRPNGEISSVTSANLSANFSHFFFRQATSSSVKKQ